MTPGEQALIEAMRLETARIYGQLQHEHHNNAPAVDEPVDVPAGVTRLAEPRKEDVA